MSSQTLTPISVPDFAHESYSKIPRWNRDIEITEKIDGTNGQIIIRDGQVIGVGSRNRWITPDSDNFGFARWVSENHDEIVSVLGDGRHFGEWWGQGIQRGYGLDHKRFTPFRFVDHSGESHQKAECGIWTLPRLYQGSMRIMHKDSAEACLDNLEAFGSRVAPGFMKPEGIVIYHTAAGKLFKATIENDEMPKGKAA